MAELKESISPVRAPLQDITNPLATDRHLKKVMYEQSTPSTKPYRTSPSGLKLHYASVVKKQQKDFEDQLMEKERQISQLMAKLEQEKHMHGSSKQDSPVLLQSSMIINEEPGEEKNQSDPLKDMPADLADINISSGLDHCSPVEFSSHKVIENLHCDSESNNSDQCPHTVKNKSPLHIQISEHQSGATNRSVDNSIDNLTDSLHMRKLYIEDNNNSIISAMDPSHAVDNIETGDTSTPQHQCHERITDLSMPNLETVSFISPLKMVSTSFASPPPKRGSPYLSLMKNTPLGRRLALEHPSSILDKSNQFLKSFENTPITADGLNAFYNSLRTSMNSAADCNVSLQSVDDLECDVSLDMSGRHLSPLILESLSHHSPAGVLSLAAELQSANSSVCNTTDFSPYNNNSRSTYVQNLIVDHNLMDININSSHCFENDNKSFTSELPVSDLLAQVNTDLQINYEKTGSTVLSSSPESNHQLDTTPVITADASCPEEKKENIYLDDCETNYLSDNSSTVQSHKPAIQEFMSHVENNGKAVEYAGEVNKEDKCRVNEESQDEKHYDNSSLETVEEDKSLKESFKAVDQTSFSGEKRNITDTASIHVPFASSRQEITDSVEPLQLFPPRNWQHSVVNASGVSENVCVDVSLETDDSLPNYTLEVSYSDNTTVSLKATEENLEHFQPIIHINSTEFNDLDDIGHSVSATLSQHELCARTTPEIDLELDKSQNNSQLLTCNSNVQDTSTYDTDRINNNAGELEEGHPMAVSDFHKAEGLESDNSKHNISLPEFNTVVSPSREIEQYGSQVTISPSDLVTTTDMDNGVLTNNEACDSKDEEISVQKCHTTTSAHKPLHYYDTPKSSRFSLPPQYRHVQTEDISCSPFDFCSEYQETMTDCPREMINACHQIQPDLIAISCSPIRYGMIDRETMTDGRMVDVKVIDIAVQVRPSVRSVFCSTKSGGMIHRETMTELRSSAVPLTNSSCQVGVKTVSTCSSPLKGLACDFATMTSPVAQSETACQIEPLITDMSCSPMKALTKNSQTSTDSVEQLNVSLQVEAETESISCSPFRIMTRDCEINTELADWVHVSSPIQPELVDSACSPVRCHQTLSEDKLMTEKYCVYNHDQTDGLTTTSVCSKCSKFEDEISVPSEFKDDVQSENNADFARAVTGDDCVSLQFNSQSTQTSPTHHQEIKMTTTEAHKRRSEIPKFNGSKTSGKHVKRYSVDDVRKRHPMVVAQEIDDLISSNDRLQLQIKCSDKERDNMNIQIDSLKLEIEEKERKLKEFEENRETEKKIMMTELKEELEKCNYKSHYENAEKIVRELQTDLASYADLENTLTQTESIQSQLQADMMLAMEEVKTMSSAFVAERTELKSQIDSLKHNEEKLKEAEENMIVQKAQIESLHNQVKRLVEKEKVSEKEIEALESSIQSITQDYQLERNRAEGLQKKYAELEIHSKETVKKKECELKNLVSTLESREEDIDNLEGQLFECRENVTEQLARKDQLTSQLNALQNDLEQNYVKKQLYETSDAKLREVESMRVKQDEKLQDTENRFSVTVVELSRVQKLYAGAGEMCNSLQNQVRELQNDLESTTEELDATKTEAQRLLMKQGSELNDCASATQHVVGNLHKILTAMKIKAGLEDQITESDQTSSPVNNDGLKTLPEDVQKDQNNTNSLVSQILIAAVDRPEQTNTVLSKSFVPAAQPSPATTSRLSLGVSSNSAFTAVSSKSWSTSSPMSAKKPSQTSAKLSLSSIESNNTSPSSLLTSPVNDAAEEIPLAEQISGMNGMFEGLIKAEKIIEKATQLSIDDLMSENKEMSDRIAVLSRREIRLKDKIRSYEQDISELKKSYETQGLKFNECFKKMTNLKNQDSVIEKMNIEIDKTMLNLKSMEAENKILHEQMEGVVKKMEFQPGEISSVQAQYERDILVLKKKLNHAKTKLMDQEGNFIKIGEKTTRRIKILEDNWNKARNEVQQFDDLVQNIQLLLLQNNDLVEKNEDLTKIMNLISGENSPRNSSDSKALPPIKTARW